METLCYLIAAVSLGPDPFTDQIFPSLAVIPYNCDGFCMIAGGSVKFMSFGTIL